MKLTFCPARKKLKGSRNFGRALLPRVYRGSSERGEYCRYCPADAIMHDIFTIANNGLKRFLAP